MGTTADKLNYLSNTKSLIKNAIVNKGQTINSGDSFRSFASKIENIQTGVNLNDYWDFPTTTPYTQGRFTQYIKQLPEIDTSQWTNLSDFFAEMRYNVTIGFNFPNFNTINITNLARTFINCQGSSVSQTFVAPNWNTSKVTCMWNTFYQSGLRDIPNWDTSKVTNTHGAFGSCRNLTNPSNTINLCNTTSAQNMFYYCTNLTTIPISNIFKLYNARQMFYYCNNLTTIPDWNFSSLNDAVNMFYGCENLTNNVSNFNFSNLKNAINMFYYCNNLISISNININNPSGTDFIDNMFGRCLRLQTISNLKIINVNRANSMFVNCTNLISISDLTLSNINIVSNMFRYCSSLTTISNLNYLMNPPSTSYLSIFEECNNLTSITNVNVHGVTNLQLMFADLINLENFSIFDTSSVENFGYAFRYCNKLSDASIQNIINMCLNSNVTKNKNTHNTNIGSPFYLTNIANTRYQNRWSELTAAGWTY